MAATRLKSKKPIRPQFTAPIMATVRAIQSSTLLCIMISSLIDSISKKSILIHFYLILYIFIILDIIIPVKPLFFHKNQADKLNYKNLYDILKMREKNVVFYISICFKVTGSLRF